MTHLIDKAALIAELNRLIAELVEEGEDTMFEQGRISAFEDVKVFINHTLEVKEEPEFTVDDIMKLDALLIRMWQSKSPNKYKEVLKQFKAQKGEEV